MEHIGLFVCVGPLLTWHYMALPYGLILHVVHFWCTFGACVVHCWCTFGVVWRFDAILFHFECNCAALFSAIVIWGLLWQNQWYDHVCLSMRAKENNCWVSFDGWNTAGNSSRIWNKLDLKLTCLKLTCMKYASNLHVWNFPVWSLPVLQVTITSESA